MSTLILCLLSSLKEDIYPTSHGNSNCLSKPIALKTQLKPFEETDYLKPFEILKQTVMSALNLFQLSSLSN